MLGFAGAGAIIGVGALLARFDIGHALRYAGKYSIVIYLTFFIPMKVAQKGLASTGIISDVGLASFIVLAVGVIAPLVGHYIIKGTPLIALYERPDWARLKARTSKVPRTALIES